MIRVLNVNFAWICFYRLVKNGMLTSKGKKDIQNDWYKSRVSENSIFPGKLKITNHITLINKRFIIFKKKSSTKHDHMMYMVVVARISKK